MSGRSMSVKNRGVSRENLRIRRRGWRESYGHGRESVCSLINGIVVEGAALASR